MTNSKSEGGSANSASDDRQSAQSNSILTQEVSTSQPFIIGMEIFILSGVDFIILGNVILLNYYCIS